MRIKTKADFARSYDAEFFAAWNAYRASPAPFSPRAEWSEHVAVLSIDGDIATIERMDEDGQMYTAEVPVDDLANIGEVE